MPLSSSTTNHVEEPTTYSTSGTLTDYGFTSVPLDPTRPHHDTNTPPGPRGDVPPVIPPEHDARTLIVCFDGTGDQFDADNSNVVQLVALLKKDDRTKQLVYYQAGIGTYTSPKVASPFFSRIRKTLDTMFATNLHAHVMSGYEFLMQHYITGDKICIFGFSRGAYTARSLAGMLHKVGLLPAGNFQQVPFAYKMYARDDHVGWEQSTEFKKAFAVDVPIEFIGVWDTVDSVGILPKRLPFTTSNTIVRTFRHAVALDERRAKFKANLWNRPTATQLGYTSQDEDDAPVPKPKPKKKPAVDGPTKKMSKKMDGSTPGEKTTAATNANGLNDSKTGGAATAPPPSRPVLKTVPTTATGKSAKSKGSMKKEDPDDKRLTSLEKMYSTRQDMTDVEEVWFAGCHCDVGGGSVSNKTRHSLARIALRWMVRECFKANTGIMFNSDALLSIGLDPSSLYPHVRPRPPPLPVGDNTIRSPPSIPIPIRPHAFLKKKNHPEVKPQIQAARAPFLGSEEEEELRDALSPKYDQLKIKKAWWVLEVLPMHLRYQRADDEWVTEFKSNLAAPRFIPQQRRSGMKVHRSVKLRMEAEHEDQKAREKGKRYVPKPVFKVEPQWVD